VRKPTSSKFELYFEVKLLTLSFLIFKLIRPTLMVGEVAYFMGTSYLLEAITGGVLASSFITEPFLLFLPIDSWITLSTYFDIC